MHLHKMQPKRKSSGRVA